MLFKKYLLISDCYKVFNSKVIRKSVAQSAHVLIMRYSWPGSLRRVSPSTLLMTVSLSNGLPNHLEFVFCYLKLFITETLIFLPHVARIKSDKGLVAAQILQICRHHPCQLRYSV